MRTCPAFDSCGLSSSSKSMRDLTASPVIRFFRGWDAKACSGIPVMLASRFPLLPASSDPPSDSSRLLRVEEEPGRAWCAVVCVIRLLSRVTFSDVGGATDTSISSFPVKACREMWCKHSQPRLTRGLMGEPQDPIRLLRYILLDLL